MAGKYRMARGRKSGMWLEFQVKSNTRDFFGFSTCRVEKTCNIRIYRFLNLYIPIE